MDDMREILELARIIELGYDNWKADRRKTERGKTNPELLQAIHSAMAGLDRGTLRVAEKRAGQWITNQWLKKAILLYFKVQKVKVMNHSGFSYVDKIPVKKWTGKEGVRVVPQAIVRQGAFVDRGAVLMPCYINIGAHVGAGTMIDTWATVGSCAQIGTNVHVSGGVGIGGVLEPLQASSVIVEDDAFIGSRCVLVEGVIIEKGAVLGANVTLTASTRIIDVTRTRPKVLRGRVPAGSVVIPGTTQKKFPLGTFGVPCALIIGKRKDSTDSKTALNDALRDHSINS